MIEHIVDDYHRMTTIKIDYIIVKRAQRLEKPRRLIQTYRPGCGTSIVQLMKALGEVVLDYLFRFNFEVEEVWRLYQDQQEVATRCDIARLPPNRDTQKPGFVSLPEIASAAYQMADAMLEDRKA